jgi:mannosyl-oligosaccharide alpha-1,2-mannosidase
VYLEVREADICPVNMLMTISIQMYDDTMTAIHSHLIQQSFKTKMTYTCELIPERNRQGEMYVYG